MAMTVFASAQPWTAPGRGLQLFGRCAEARGSQVTIARRLYGKRFRGYARWEVALARDAPGREYRFYRFGVTKVKLLDEGEFGPGVFVVADVRRRA